MSRPIDIASIKDRWKRVQIRAEAIRLELEREMESMKEIHGTTDSKKLKMIQEDFIRKIAVSERKMKKVVKKIDKLLKKYES